MVLIQTGAEELVFRGYLQQQADQQWLDAIPDDPGGLLRQKFLRDHYRKQAVAKGS